MQDEGGNRAYCRLLRIVAVHRLLMKVNLSVIIAGIPINVVVGLITLGLIKDLDQATIVSRPLKWPVKGSKER